GFDLNSLWRHAILTAQTSAFLAKRSKRSLDLTPEEFHVCGLLHDIGKVVLLDSMGTEYLEAVDEAVTLGERQHITEERRFGFNHTDVGAMVAVRWGLPVPAIAAIQFHHGPRESVEEDPVVALVANANILAHRVEDGRHEEAMATLDLDTTNFLELERQDVHAIVDFATEALTTIEV
ncbi:MAG: hypothetical protein DRJ42_29715, partial [Deltaproteobacteria bacterium]